MEQQIEHERENLKKQQSIIDMEKEDAFSVAMFWIDKYKSLVDRYNKLNSENDNQKSTINILNAKIIEKDIEKHDYIASTEESQLMLDEYKTLYSMIQKKNQQLMLDLEETDKNARMSELENKK